MRTVMVLLPARTTPSGTTYVGGALPRPPPAGAAPRPAPGTNGAGVSDWPLIQTSPMFRSGPSDSVVGAAPVQSNERVNQTTPSKSGRPRDSQLPGTSMLDQSLASSAHPRVCQSAFFAPTAGASPSPVTGTTTTLSVLGADDGGEANLTYTWIQSGTPPAPVAFSINGTNAAKNTVATFTTAGTYDFQVTITDGFGCSVTSTVSVQVTQVATSISLVP